MLGFINLIGQRKTSKLLCGLTFFISMLIQVLAYGANYASVPAFWMGCLLITLPTVLLCASVHFTKKHRLKCLYAQFILVILNALILLFVDRAYLIQIYMAEVIVAAVITLFFYALPETSSQPVRKRRSSRKPTSEESNISNKD